ncbi:MAG: dTMP kinase [Candidatus Bathyarchaeia archaeon]
MVSRKNGFFIVLDGIDGCGKTVQSKILQRKLSKMGIPSKYTAEPSAGFVGAYLKRLLASGKKMPPMLEVLLFAADRFDHLKSCVEVEVNKGCSIVCDRYVYASLAYQGAQGVELNWIREVNNFALKPDVSIYLDVDPEVGLRRRGDRRSIFEYLELERKAREIYLQLVKEGEMIYVNSMEELSQVSQKIFDITVNAIKKIR